MSWLVHWLGLDDASGGPYLFWSGIGANISASAIVLALLRSLHVHTCHAKGCYRIGRHIIPGTTYVACRKHQAVPTPTPAESSHSDAARRDLAS